MVTPAKLCLGEFKFRMANSVDVRVKTQAIPPAATEALGKLHGSEGLAQCNVMCKGWLLNSSCEESLIPSGRENSLISFGDHYISLLWQKKGDNRKNTL